MIRQPRGSTLFPYTTLCRSKDPDSGKVLTPNSFDNKFIKTDTPMKEGQIDRVEQVQASINYDAFVNTYADRKSTRLNSSHANISYAVFCLKKNDHQHITSHS